MTLTCTHEYLNRIGFYQKPKTDLKTLFELHQTHMLHIPFENLDIHYGRVISLNFEHLFNKVVKAKRGGYCYELNYLFYLLLIELGFNAKIISGRIFNNDQLGPEFDHMSIIVNIENEIWLVDVGFGNLFTKPLKVNSNNVHTERYNSFKIEQLNAITYVLSMSEKNKSFERKYTFDLSEKIIDHFFEQNEIKQNSSQSHFVKNKICTISTKNGRKTIFNNKFIKTNGGKKREIDIINIKEEGKILKSEFGIILYP